MFKFVILTLIVISALSEEIKGVEKEGNIFIVNEENLSDFLGFIDDVMGICVLRFIRNTEFKKRDFGDGYQSTAQRLLDSNQKIYLAVVNVDTEADMKE